MTANRESASTPRELGGRFDILSLLKRGHGVETLRARDRQSGADAVVRTSPIGLVSTGAWMRLEHDTAVLAQARRALAFGRAQGLVYTARPFFVGEPLSERLRRGPLSVRETIEVGRGLLAELRAAHAQGVLHRDVKPSNVIVGAQPIIVASEVTLVDFGLARSERLDGRTSAESAELACYFSPEQAGLLEHAIDERSDLYALGLILYECLEGRPPFSAGTLGEMLRLHLSEAPPPLTSRISIPRALESLVLHLLKKDPRERYQSASGALADAAQISAQLAGGVIEPEVLIGLGDSRSTLLEPAFVGRSKELQALEQEIARAGSGGGSLTVLEAESGGGKTRFLDELARRSVRSSAWVLRGQGLDQNAQRPFQMLSGLVDELLSRARAEPLFAERLRSSLSEQAPALRAAIPELGALFVSAESDQLGDEQHGETRSLDALAALLNVLGEPPGEVGGSGPGKPAVLLLDDCQWADEPTLKLLAQIRRRRSPKNLVAVVAFRTEAVSQQHLLRSLHPELHLALAPLGRDELRDLAQSMAGALPEEALRAIEQLADGSPFMASAVLRGSVESGALIADKGGWKIDPAAMADLRASQRDAGFLARRLALLPARSLELLTVGAVLGKQFELQAVGALCGLAPAALLPAIAAARQRHIVWMRGDEDCVFVHDKLRETLLGRLSQKERAALHLKAAVYLESQPGDRALEIAFHFDAAGEFPRALPFALASARSARARFALDLAERQYRIAQRGAGQAGQETRLAIAEGLGDVLLLRGSYDDAEKELTRAAEMAPDVLLRAQLEGKLGELAFKRGDMATAALRLEGALGSLGRQVPGGAASFFFFAVWEIAVQTVHSFFPRWTNAKKPLEGSQADRTAMRLYSRLTYLYWFQRGKVPCLWAQLRGMNLAERYPPTAELAQSYSEHAPVMSMVPMFDRGLRYAQRSLEIRRSLGDVWGQGQSLHFIGVVLYAASRIRECLAACREAVRLLQRTGDRWEVNTAGWHIAFCLYRLGELREAAAQARQVWEAGQEIGDTQASGIALGVWAKATGGRVPREALEAELSRPSEDIHTAAEILTAHAAQLLLARQPRAAVEALSRAQGKIDRKGLQQEYVAAVLPWLLTALVRDAESAPLWAPGQRKERLTEATQVAKRALRLSRIYRNNLPHALRGAGELSALKGEGGKARRLLEESVREAKLLEARAEEALSVRMLARLGVAEGIPGSEEDEARAEENLHTLGMLAESQTGAPTLSLADRFTALLEAGRQIATALTPDEVEAAVARASQTLLRAQGFRFVRLDAGLRPGAPLLALSPAETSLAEEALQLRRPVARAAIGDELPGRARCALCALVQVRGVARAIFFATHNQLEQALGETELQLASFIASLAGAALENCDGIDHLQHIERDLALSEKMAALGTLAAGVAHEINNPLSYVLTNLEFVAGQVRALAVRHKLLEDPGFTEVQEALGEAREGAERVSDIVRDLRLYSSADEQTPRGVEVTRALEAMITLSKAEVKNRARLVRDFRPVPLVLASETRLGQVFLNLLINAAQAIPEGRNDTNEIRVSAHTDERGFAVVEISDTGAGIPPEARARIFDPFFTTKQVGEGTGLGLSICLGIVRALGGDITVESEPGKGSTFRVSLPPAPDGVRAVNPPAVVMSATVPLRVLVVDDEPSIGAALTRMLDGHRVTVELRARPALERLTSGEPFDLVLCDLMMPEMSGMEMFTELASHSPALAVRVAFITGGAVSERGREFLARTKNLVFEKPFQPDLLRDYCARIGLAKEAAALKPATA